MVCGSPGRLDAVLAAALPDLSRARLAGLIRDGHVRVNGAPVVKPADKVRRGAVIDLELPPPEPSGAVPQDLPVRVVYEDADVVVVDKPAGMVVHPGAGHADGTLVNALLHQIGDLSGIGGVLRPGIVHRLDRGTSGLLVVAKHDAAHHVLADQFADRTAGRTYLALVFGGPPRDEGTIDAPIGRHRTHRVRFSSVNRDGPGKPAVTDWAVVGRGDGVTLVRCSLRTGRTHQIRVHLTDAGWPLVGDPLYRKRGTKLPDGLVGLVDPEADRPLLHAWKLRFTHPRSGEPIDLATPLPDDFVAALAAVGLVDPTR